MEDNINFDRHDIGQVSLVEASECINRIHNNKHFWKYAIISIHNALQCYLSIALRDGSGIDTWKDSHSKKWLKAYDECLINEGIKDLPNVQLDNFMNLYDKLLTEKSAEKRELINWLNDTRNAFIHFNNDLYSVHESDMMAAFKLALETIQEIPSLSKGIFFYNEKQQENFTITCNELTNKLDLLKRSMYPITP